MAILPNAIYRFNASPIKIPTQFFADIKRAILNFVWKNKKPRIAITILNNKNHLGALYYRAIELKKTARCLYRQTVQSME